MLDFKRPSNELPRFYPLPHSVGCLLFETVYFRVCVCVCVCACVRACVCVSPYRPNRVHQLTFRRDTTYDNILPPEDVNPGIAQQTRNRIHFAKLCREEEWCNSYFYNEVTRFCLRHRTVHLAPPAIASLSEEGWRYFRHGSGI